MFEVFLFLKFWFWPNWLLVESEELRVCHSEESDQPKLAGTRVLGNISDWFCQQIAARKRHNSNKFSSLFPKLCEKLFRVTIHCCSFYWLLLPWICYKLVENIDITLLWLRNFPPNEALLLSLQSIFLNLVSAEQSLKSLWKTN